MKFYEGCTTLITGASDGLGAEFARQLAPHVQALVLVARRVDRLEVLRDELQGLHPQLTVYIYGADVGNEDQRLGLASWLDAGNLKVDFLINNAGFGDRGAFEDSDWEKVRGMIDVNITALTHLIHVLLPSMTEGGRAAILNVSSVASFFPLPNMAVYGATKAYVLSFSIALAAEVADRGIFVSTVCPGPVDTEFAQVASNGAREKVVDGKSPAAVVAHALRSIERGRRIAVMAPKWKFKAFMSRFVGRYGFARHSFIHEKRPSK